ncbi:MAG TPA: DUF4394 domain-containing protein [Pirellulaceae bacterium]|jgi:hypothetical protein|nr:DUF4394 domain-containing protein [Pirellulaceae bacterium]
MRKSIALRAATALAIVACATGLSTASAERLKALSSVTFQPVLIEIDSEDTEPLVRIQKIVGVAEGQLLKALDLRPATGDLYAIGVDRNFAQLYLLEDDGGPSVQATAVGPRFSGLQNPPGAEFGMDFNPTIDRIRLVSTLDQNIVFNPNDGTTTVATRLSYADGDRNDNANPAVAHIAYDQNVDGAEMTTQRGIDVDLDVVVTVANNEGTLNTIGRLGVDASAVGGFDVASTGAAFAVLTVDGTQRIYRVNKSTGAVSELGVPALGFFPLSGLTAMP